MDREPMTNMALRWTAIALTAAALYVCWQLWSALVLAVWTAALARPLLSRLERALKGRRRAAAVLSLLLFLFLAVPVGLVVVGVVVGAQDLWLTIAKTSSAKSALEAVAASSDGASLWPKTFQQLTDLLQQYGAESLKIATRVAGATAKGLVALLIYFAGAYVFLLDGPDLWSWLKRRSPLGPQHLERLATAFHETGRGLLVGVGLTSATQGLIATLIYLALGIPRWWVLGPITGMVSMVPLVGSALVWGPITVGLFLTGHHIKGPILAVLGVGVISTADNLLRPIYAKMGALKMPMYLLFVSLFGGIAAFGTWGAILGPLIFRLWMEAVALRQESKESKESKESQEALAAAAVAGEK